MTVNDVLTAVDELCPNGFSTARKIQWLRALEGQLHGQIVTAHEGLEDAPAPSDLTPDTTLLVGGDYGEVYVHYLLAQMAQANGETARYNDAAAAYRAALNNWENALRRRRMPRSGATHWRVL